MPSQKTKPQSPREEVIEAPDVPPQFPDVVPQGSTGPVESVDDAEASEYLVPTSVGGAEVTFRIVTY